MEIGSVYNNQTDIQSLLVSSINGAKYSGNDNYKNETANYAKKGEPMYMAEMDSDEDGVVTLDEFREYCKSKGISTKSMMKMSQMAYSYRVMKAEEESIDYISKLIPNISPKLKQAETGNLKQSGTQYNISNDPNNDKKVPYQEYMEYCKQNVVNNDLKTNAKVDDSEEGAFKISNPGKAVKSYMNNERNAVKTTFEESV